MAQGNEEQVGGEASLFLPSVRPTANAKVPQTLQVYVRPYAIRNNCCCKMTDRLLITNDLRPRAPPPKVVQSNASSPTIRCYSDDLLISAQGRRAPILETFGDCIALWI